MLPAGVPRLAVEAGVRQGWRAYVGDRGAVIGIDRFGASAPGAEVARELGVDAPSVLAAALDLVRDNDDGGQS